MRTNTRKTKNDSASRTGRLRRRKRRVLTYGAVLLSVLLLSIAGIWLCFSPKGTSGQENAALQTSAADGFVEGDSTEAGSSAVQAGTEATREDAANKLPPRAQNVASGDAVQDEKQDADDTFTLTEEEIEQLGLTYFEPEEPRISEEAACLDE